MTNADKLLKEIVDAVTIAFVTGMRRETIINTLIPSYKNKARKEGKSEHEIAKISAGLEAVIDTIYAG
jgi:hypothetical protein